MTPPVVLVYRTAGEDWDSCLAALAATAPAGVEVRACEDVAVAADAAAPADVVVVDRPVRLGPGWVEGLRAAAESDSTVGVVAAIELGAIDVERAAAALREDGSAMRPRLPTGAPAVRWVRRAALEVAGPLDGGFWDRCRANGLLHVVADDVPALPLGEPTPEPGDPADVSRGEERPPNPLERGRANARRVVDGLAVTVDARALEYPAAGTQVHLLSVLRALAESGEARVRAVLPTTLPPDSAAALDAIDGLDRLVAEDFNPQTHRTPVVHRPHQITSPHDLTLLRHVGERLVVTHQDLILFHNPSYHEGPEEWGHHRRLTAGALATADLIVCFSRHAADDLLAEGLADPHRVRVVPLAAPAAGEMGADAPAALERLGGRPFLVCVGTDLRHKNRLWAIRLLDALKARGWEGALVFAGPHVRHGGTVGEEPDRPDVLDLGPVSDRDRGGLYARAAASLYPTAYEGFGLVPFESAAAGTPCLWAPQASLAEVLPGAATLVPWNAEASAERALPILRDPAAAAALVQRVRDAAATLSWERTARGLLDAYAEAIRLPAREGAETRWRFLEIEAMRGEAHARYTALREEVGDVGLALVGDGGVLPDDVQRALAALGRRRATREPLFRLLRTIHRLGRRR